MSQREDKWCYLQISYPNCYREWVKYYSHTTVVQSRAGNITSPHLPCRNKSHPNGAITSSWLITLSSTIFIQERDKRNHKKGTEAFTVLLEVTEVAVWGIEKFKKPVHFLNTTQASYLAIRHFSLRTFWHVTVRTAMKEMIIMMAELHFAALVRMCQLSCFFYSQDFN